MAEAAQTMGPVLTLSLGHSSSAPEDLNVSTRHFPSFEGTVAWHRHHPKIRTMLEFGSDDLQFVADEVRKFEPDVCLLEGVGVAAALPILEAFNIPVVLDMHNIESDLYRSIWRSSTPVRYLKDVLFGSKRWNGVRQFDRESSLRATETWVTSDRDCSRLLSIGGAKAEVIPNPIPNEEFARFPISADRYAAGRALFVGHLSYPPNISAARELARKVWPPIHKLDQSASLLISGRTPTSTVARLSGLAGIEVVADPERLDNIYETRGYSLMPIRQGGGTRLKVLEAMVAGVIVIATEKAIEGLGLEAGRQYLRAETPTEFLDHFQHCRSNPSLTVEFAQGAKEFAVRKFGSVAFSAKVKCRLAKIKENF